MTGWDRPWSVDLIGGQQVSTDVLGELVTVEGPLWALTPNEARAVAHALITAAAVVDGLPSVHVELGQLSEVAGRLGVPLADLMAALGQGATNDT